MVFLRRVPLLALLVWAWAGLVATAADYAFVFHAGVTASVFDAASLDLIGTPNVGANARQAIGVPDPANPTSFLKIYIIAAATFVVVVVVVVVSCFPRRCLAVRSHQLLSSVSTTCSGRM